MGRLQILTSAALAAVSLATSAAAQPSPNTPPAQPGSQLFPPGPSAPAGQPGLMPLPPAPVIYTVEQIAVQQVSPELRQALTPLHTLQEAEDALKVRGVAFIWRRGEINSASLPADFARQIAGLPPREVFIIPQGQGAVLNVIVQQRPAPAAGAGPSPTPGQPAPTARPPQAPAKKR